MKTAAILILLLVSDAFAQPTTAPAIVVPASIAAFYSTDIYPKDSGYVLDVKADIGDRVTKGQVLAEIDDPELVRQIASLEATVAAKEELAKASEAAIAQAEAGVEVARKQLAGLESARKLAQVTLKRQEALFADKAATDQQVDEYRSKADAAVAAADVGQAKIAAAQADLLAAKANRAVAAAQVRVAAADLGRAQTLLGYTKIVAPFDGTITRRWVNPGDLVQAATAGKTTPLFTCQKLDVVRVMCEVPEISAVGIGPGTKADVKLMGSSAGEIHAAVTRIGTSLDPATRTMRAEIELQNPNQALRPGMYAQVTLTPQATGK
jgi:multidrug resistance efflux pump